MQTFNLIDQPWISVKMTDSSIKLMSLQNCFKQANEIKDLAGDSKAQELIHKQLGRSFIKLSILQALWII